MSFKFEIWPTEFRTINQYFGVNPQDYNRFGLPGHEGIDIHAPHGSRIFVVAAGEVSMVQHNPNAHNYGKHVRVKHIDGYETIYAHLHEIHVRQGQRLNAGDVIGLADDTGNSFGSHLHLTLKKQGEQLHGYPPGFIDPAPFLTALLGFERPAGPYIDGWAYSQGITVSNDFAQANSGGINLRAEPSVNATIIGLVPEGTVMIIAGNKRNLYTPVKVPQRALPNAGIPAPLPPETAPPPTIATVDGWGWRDSLTVTGNQAVVGEFGINLRQQADQNSSNIGLVRGGSTVTVTGSAMGNYLSVRVRRDDFSGPVNLPTVPPAVDSPQAPIPNDAYIGWAWTPYLTPTGRQALVGRFGINLRNEPNPNSQNIGLLKGGATVTIVGQSKGEYTPVVASRNDVLNIPTIIPPIAAFTPLPTAVPGSEAEPEVPPQATTPGWAFTAAITIIGETAVAGQYGLNLRTEPRRNAENVGFIPGNSQMVITGPPQGEYTPIRIDNNVLQQPFDTIPTTATIMTGSTTTPTPSAIPSPTPSPTDPVAFGQARIGLHASADPGISATEIAIFKTLRPSIIKLLSFHDPDAIRKMVANHPDVQWIVRAFLDFGGRNISPAQFVNDTISDMQRTLNILRGKDVVLELHNEPNLVAEGLGQSWQDGATFATWWLAVLDRYRRALPGYRFIYPGLSPGGDVANIKQDHIRFLEQSRAALEAADGLGVHIYWSDVYPMSTALGVLDDYIFRARFKPIWVTEASNNKAGTSPLMKGREYVKFWGELQQRPTVQGVTYFVASASNPQFAEEVWVGRGIAEAVGRR